MSQFNVYLINVKAKREKQNGSVIVYHLDSEYQISYNYLVCIVHNVAVQNSSHKFTEKSSTVGEKELCSLTQNCLTFNQVVLPSSPCKIGPISLPEKEKFHLNSKNKIKYMDVAYTE